MPSSFPEVHRDLEMGLCFCTSALKLQLGPESTVLYCRAQGAVPDREGLPHSPNFTRLECRRGRGGKGIIQGAQKRKNYA